MKATSAYLQRLFLSVFFLASTTSFGWNAKKKVKKDDQEALQKTQDLLKNRKAVEEFSKESPEAQQTLEQVKKLGGTQENTDAMFAIAADIMSALVAESDGDPAKMQALLAEAQKDPEKFYNKFTDEQKAQIRKVAGNIEKNQSPTK